MTLVSPNSPAPPPPIEKDPVRVRSGSSTRRRPAPPPKERRRSGGSTLQLVANNAELLTPSHGVAKRRSAKTPQRTLFNQLASIKQWFKANAKRAKSPSDKKDHLISKTSPASKQNGLEARRNAQSILAPRAQEAANISVAQHQGAAYVRPKVPTPRQRSSMSPAPVTPRSSYRLSTGPVGLRGRKSTSSSVSSIRSIHHLPSHSKASSTSSTNSIHSSVQFSKNSRSPHSSVKVLPSTPTFGTFPSNIRLVRGTTNYNESAHFSSPTNLVFAKRKKTPFRGPHLTLGTSLGDGLSVRHRDSGASVSRSASVAGRASGEIIEEEDEEDIEEVDTFSPVAPESDETIWDSSTKVA